MEMSYAIGRYEQAAELLPPRWQQAARRVPDFRKAQAEEFRLRAGRPMTLVTTEGELFVSDELPRQSVTQSDLEQLCDTVTGYSRYAASESMGKGYLVGRGGFRVGLCGTVVLRDGVGVNLRDISSASVRISRQAAGLCRDMTQLLPEGESFQSTLIAAPPGAGKTTLLNILGGMDTATSGHVRLDGREITGLGGRALTEYRRNDVGFVFQFYNLVQNLTARENVELAAEICRGSLPAEEVLTKLGLADRMDNFPAQLSGGEQQRVSIARALAKNPKMILCDEPTGALDYQTGKAVLKLLQVTCRETGKTVLIITHNSALTRMADRVIHIRSGQAVGTEVNRTPTPIEQIEW